MTADRYETAMVQPVPPDPTVRHTLEQALELLDVTHETLCAVLGPGAKDGLAGAPDQLPGIMGSAANIRNRAAELHILASKIEGKLGGAL